jgi:phage portal protein BeeE
VKIGDWTVPWIFKKKPERHATEEPVSPIYVMAGQPIRLLSSAAALEADTMLRTSPQLYRIANFLSSAVQSVPWFCEPDPTLIASERAGASQVKIVNDLLRSPNDTFTPQQLQYWITLNLMLYARAHFKVGVSSTGKPNGIYPLAAKHVMGIPNSRGSIEAYKYGMPPNETVLPTRRAAEKRGPAQSYAAEISFPSLTGLVEYNKAPAAIESINTPLAIINALMQRALDTVNGHPNIKYVITAEKTLTKAQKDALHKYLESSGPGDLNSGNVLFLYNTDIKVHELDNALGDIHSKIPMDDMTRQIAGVFGVPIAIIGLGSADAAKYANNYPESRLSFWQDTIVPCYLSPIASGMTAAICPPGARVVFDYDAVPALWAGRSKLGESLSDVAFLTTNEKRRILGYAPDDSLPALIAGPRMQVPPSSEAIVGPGEPEPEMPPADTTKVMPFIRRDQ